MSHELPPQKNTQTHTVGGEVPPPKIAVSNGKNFWYDRYEVTRYLFLGAGLKFGAQSLEMQKLQQVLGGKISLDIQANTVPEVNFCD